MLLNVDTNNVPLYLNPNKAKLKSKGVTSVVSRIMNLNSIKPELDHAMLCLLIEKEFIKHFAGYAVNYEKLSYESLSKLPKVN